MEETYTCIVCKQKAHTNENLTNSLKGIVFSGYGGYGSKYDTSAELFIYVCDGCLTVALPIDDSIKVKEVIQQEKSELKSVSRIDSVW